MLRGCGWVCAVFVYYTLGPLTLAGCVVYVYVCVLLLLSLGGRADRRGGGRTNRPGPPTKKKWQTYATAGTRKYSHDVAAAGHRTGIGVRAEMAEEAQRRIVANRTVVLAAVLVRADEQTFVAALGDPPRAGHLVVGRRRANGELATGWLVGCVCVFERFRFGSMAEFRGARFVG